MVDGSAQRGARLSCSCICRERGFVRWGLQLSKCVFVEGGKSEVTFIVACVFCVLRVLRYCGSVGPLTASSLMRAAAGAYSNAVDVYNGATGAWSTAQLSVARYWLAAASVGNVALFAGGYTGNVYGALFVQGGKQSHNTTSRAKIQHALKHKQQQQPTPTPWASLHYNAPSV